MKEQQRVDPELAWVVRWRETVEEPTARFICQGNHVIYILIKTGPV
jgi:hypothetical protein